MNYRITTPCHWLGLARAILASATLLVAATALHAQRNMENLGRGIVAVRSSSTQVLVSWRLLGLDPAGIGFNVYRGSTKLNSSVLTAGTNFVDTSANLAVANTYSVRTVIGGVEQPAAGAAFTLKANNAVEPIVRVPLVPAPADYYTKFIWVGDLDGDKEYDYVIDRLAPFDPANNDIGLGNQFLEGYKRDGTRLWRIDMGPNSRNTYNIEPGSSTISMGMYDGATVYDLNNDGKAEVILKISNGVRFPNGTTFTNANNLLQFLAVIDGMTGNMITNIAFPTDYLTDGSLGTQLGIGYPDGVNPAVYLWGRNRVGSGGFNDVFACYNYNGSSLSQRWKRLVPSGTTGVAASHQMRIADVDGNGTDEMMTGNMCVNADGTMRYQLSGIGHGDRFYVAKLDPNRAGLQGYGIQQNPGPPYILEYYYDANTGAVLWTHTGQAGDDVGRGIVGDVDPAYLGYEVWSFHGLHNGRSNQLISADLYPYPVHTFWWDGDITSENLNDAKFEKWNPANPTPTNAAPRLLLTSDYGAVISNHNPMFLGDIMGDWRSEVILLNPTHTELIIFTTNIPSSTRIYTMPHNPAYRTHMTVKGYLQSPLLDYYLGAGMATPPVPNIKYVGTAPTGVTIQGEAAVIAGGVTIDSDRAGFNGTGFLNFPVTGGSAEFRNLNGGSGGSKTISIRFANGSSNGTRVGRLLVNGGAAQNITFTSDLNWTSWRTLNVTVTLAAGTNNTIRLESNGQDLANIDQITIP
ncbi:MAG TPA: carbohydrate-binding protein [Opitutaceae bacterium]|nr:carbohydrate-binding protein [Opitutaceae bacterium]